MLKTILWLGYLGLFSKIENKYLFLILTAIDTFITLFIKILSGGFGHDTILANTVSYITFFLLVSLVNTIFFFFLQKTYGTFWFYIIFFVGYLLI